MRIEKRNIALCILFTIVTCGIYAFYWIYKLNDEINTIGERTNAPSGGMVILFSIITCGIYEIYWYYKMGETIENIHMRYNRSNGSSQIVYMVLGIIRLGIINLALMQNEINEAVGE